MPVPRVEENSGRASLLRGSCVQVWGGGAAADGAGSGASKGTARLRIPVAGGGRWLAAPRRPATLQRARSLRPSLDDRSFTWSHACYRHCLVSARGAPALPSPVNHNFPGACLRYSLHGVGAFIPGPSKFPGTLKYTLMQSGWILALSAPVRRHLTLRTGPFLPVGLAARRAARAGVFSAPFPSQTGMASC